MLYAFRRLPRRPKSFESLVLSGEFEFTIGDETKVVKAGDTMYKEPHIMHGCVCLKPGVLIDTFTPMRQDFVEA